MARFTSTKGKKESTSEKRQRKLANRAAHQYVLWAWLALVAVLVVSFAVIFYASRRAKAEEPELDPEMLERFSESLSEFMTAEVLKAQNEAKGDEM